MWALTEVSLRGSLNGMKHSRKNAVAFLLCSLVVGCSKSSPNLPPLVPVTGTITWEGKPLVGAMVLYIPQPGAPGQGGTARTDADGKYTLTAMVRNEPGVAAGPYKVMISTPLMDEGYTPEPNAPPFTKVLIPEQYGHREKTILTADVSPGMEPKNFDLPHKQ